MDEIKQLVKNSFIASFISDKEKSDYCNQVDAAFAKL
jgi:adenosine deaminase